MAIDQVDRTVVTQEPTTAGPGDGADGHAAAPPVRAPAAPRWPGASSSSSSGSSRSSSGRASSCSCSTPGRPTPSCPRSSTSARCSSRRSRGSCGRTPSHAGGLGPRRHRHRGPRRLDDPRADRALGRRASSGASRPPRSPDRIAVPVRTGGPPPPRDRPRAGATRKEQLHGHHRLDRRRRASPASSPTSSWAPGEGLLMMIVLGIVGAVVGGFIAGSVLGIADVTGFNLQQPRRRRVRRHRGDLRRPPVHGPRLEPGPSEGRPARKGAVSTVKGALNTGGHD